MSDIKLLYDAQARFQQLIDGGTIPRDDPEMLAHHLLGLVTEVGEVAQADKRWKKNKRNGYYDYNEKLEEIADCFIFLLNICIYSSISPDELKMAVVKKIDKNRSRYLNSKEEA